MIVNKLDIYMCTKLIPAISVLCIAAFIINFFDNAISTSLPLSFVLSRGTRILVIDVHCIINLQEWW